METAGLRENLQVSFSVTVVIRGVPPSCGNSGEVGHLRWGRDRFSAPAGGWRETRTSSQFFEGVFVVPRIVGCLLV